MSNTLIKKTSCIFALLLAQTPVFATTKLTTCEALKDSLVEQPDPENGGECATYYDNLKTLKRNTNSLICQGIGVQDCGYEQNRDETPTTFEVTNKGGKIVTKILSQ